MSGSSYCRVLLIVIALGDCCACSAHRPEPNLSEPGLEPGDNVLDISNADVQWAGDFDGLTPRISQRAAALHRDEATIAALIAMLSDPEKFVIAHVALTTITGLQYSSFPAWNGLQVQLTADGATTIDPEQRHDLTRRWQLWQAATPRPRTLP